MAADRQSLPPESEGSVARPALARAVSVHPRATPKGPVTIHTTHIPPGSSNGCMKVQMLEAIAAVVAAPGATPQILCGDFNVPQAELSDGRIATWAERMAADSPPRPRARMFGKDARRWDAAERTIMVGGRDLTLVDAYRGLHGYGRQEFSWFVKRHARRVGRRFDHVFCSRELRILRCEYLHDVRERGLSDHSALEVDFDL
jgi:exonuclease III